MTDKQDLSPNAEAVRRAFDEVANGDPAPFWDLVADDAVWRTIGTTTWSGEFQGKEAIVNDIFRPLGRRLAHRAIRVTRIVDGGDVVAVQARGKAATHTGVPYDNDYCFVLGFRDGRIASYEEYCDTALVANVLGDRLAIWRPQPSS